MGTRRKAVVAAAISLFGVAAVVPMVVSGPASAEEGFRICGLKLPGHKGGSDGEKPRFLVYKVFKGDESTCDAARKTDPAEELNPSEGEPIGPETCESMTSTMTQVLGGKINELVSNDGREPVKNENDLCFNMRPSSVSLEGTSGENAFGYRVADANSAASAVYVVATALKAVRWEIRDSTPPFDPPCC